MFQGEACTKFPASCTELWACLHCVPACWANPYKGVVGIIFQPIRDFPGPVSYPAISFSIFKEQPEQLHSNQTGQCFLSIQTVRIWRPHLHEDGPIKDQGRDFSVYKSAPLCLLGVHFSIPPRLVFPQLELKHGRHLADQDGAELPRWRGAWMESHLPSSAIPQLSCNLVELLHCHVSSSLSYLHWIKSPSCTLNWGFLLALNWHQWPSTLRGLCIATFSSLVVKE